MSISDAPRHDPFAGPAVSDAPTLPVQQTQKLESWFAQLGKSRLAEQAQAQVQDLLTQLAHGSLPVDHAKAAPAVFNLLIEHEVYGVFVDAFQVYNQIQTSRAGNDGVGGSLFKSSLVLQLPRDWHPLAEAEMTTAFEQIVVHKVVVMRPPLPAQSDDNVNVPRHQRLHPQRAVPVPSAVGTCLAALLKNGGVRELVVPGALANARVVSLAFSSSQLASVTLGDSAAVSTSLTAAELKSHQMLLAGLARCASLKHLRFAHVELANLHATLAFLQPADGPSLTSVALTGEALDLDASVNHFHSTVEIQSFMQVVGQMSSLASLEVNATTARFTHLYDKLLTPLGWSTLSRLSIVGNRYVPPNAANMGVLPTLGAFFAAHPSLHDFTWDAGPGHPDAALHLDECRRAGVDVVRAEDAVSMANLMGYLNFALRKLTFRGVPLASAPVKALFGVLKVNPSFEFMDLTDCALPADALPILLDALGQNTRMQVVVLSPHYYLVIDDGSLHGCVPDGSPHTQRFHVVHTRQGSSASREKAEAVLASLQGQLSTTAPQALIHRRMREAMMKEAWSPLQENVARFMAAKLGEKGVGRFGDVAQVVLDNLGEHGDLRRAVRLSELRTPTDLLSRADFKVKATPKVVKQFVRLVNRDAVLRGLDWAPLAVNTVNADGANEQLLDAAVTNNASLVLSLRKEGAIDFKGLAAKAANTRAVAEAFRMPLVEVPDTKA